MSPKPTLVIMVKEPRPGRVKTRLGREIGMVSAAWWYRHHVRLLVRSLKDPRWRIVIALDGRHFPLPGADAVMAQGKGDLGRRMIRQLQMAGPRSVLIGSDIKGIRPPHIQRAIDALGTHDAVLGPAPDGGYWLIGLKHPARHHPDCLEGTRWSSPHARADSIERLRGRVALVDVLSDVDEASDLP